MKYCYPVTTPECKGNIKAIMESYDKAFSWLRECGYDGVELLTRDPAAVDIQLLDEKLAEYDLQIAAIGTSPMQIEDKLFLMHPDKANRDEARSRFTGLIELGRHFNAPVLYGKYRGMLRDEPGCSRDDLLNVTLDVCNKAAEAGIRVLLEPQNPTNINNLNTIDESLSWIIENDIPALGLLADIYHMGITEPDICASLVKAMGYIGFIHMSDSERKIPGTGSLPLREVYKTLVKSGYPAYVSFEINQLPDSFTAAQQSIHFMRSCV